MSKIIFQEKQRFNQWWVIAIIVLMIGVAIYGSIEKGISTLEVFLSTYGVLLAVVLLFVSIQLNTRIDSSGIHVKMFPFHWKFVSYRWQDIEAVEVVEYSPIKEYGGYGVRYNGNGKAFNVKGKNGIKMNLNTGKERLIGTQLPKEAQQAITDFKNISH